MANSLREAFECIRPDATPSRKQFEADLEEARALARIAPHMLGEHDEALLEIHGLTDLEGSK